MIRLYQNGRMTLEAQRLHSEFLEQSESLEFFVQQAIERGYSPGGLKKLLCESIKYEVDLAYQKTLKKTAHPHDWDIDANFPGHRTFRVGEGVRVLTAERGDKFFVIVDNSTLVEFLDDDEETQTLIDVLEFPDNVARTEYLEVFKSLGEPKRAETGPIQFGDDWPGVFFRGDDAIRFRQSVNVALGSVTGELLRAMLTGLANDLESCQVIPGAPARAKELRSFAECLLP